MYCNAEDDLLSTFKQKTDKTSMPRQKQTQTAHSLKPYGP